MMKSRKRKRETIRIPPHGKTLKMLMMEKAERILEKVFGPKKPPPIQHEPAQAVKTILPKEVASEQVPKGPTEDRQDNNNTPSTDQGNSRHLEEEDTVEKK